MADHLEEIPLKFIPVLRDKFLIDWPRYISAYYTIDNYINWMWFGDISILSLNGDWRETGTFVILDKNVIFFDTLDGEGSIENLSRALSLLNYNREFKEFRILPFRICLKPAIFEVIKTKNLEITDEVFDAHLLYLSKEEAQNIENVEIEKMEFRRIEKHYAKYMDDLWAGKCDGSRQYLERLLDYNPSLGLFDMDGKLVAWILRREYGSAGLLFVHEDYRQKGYGYQLSKQFVKMLGEMGYDITVSIRYPNKVSTKIFESLGFRKIDDDSRFQICPK